MAGGGRLGSPVRIAGAVAFDIRSGVRAGFVTVSVSVGGLGMQGYIYYMDTYTHYHERTPDGTRS